MLIWWINEFVVGSMGAVAVYYILQGNQLVFECSNTQAHIYVDIFALFLILCDEECKPKEN